MSDTKCPYPKGLENPPKRMANLPIAENGYLVPWFVCFINGKPDFRVADAKKLYDAVADNLCWVCGEKMGSYKAFVVGPMCGLNRTSAEPPSHYECGLWSTQVCPFLKNPDKVRREKGLDQTGAENPGGIMIKRNPGVTLIWTTKYYKLFKDPNGRPLIEFGPPVRVEFFCQGRPATQEEISDSIESGLPLLMAEAEKAGPADIKILMKMKEEFEQLWKRG